MFECHSLSARHARPTVGVSVSFLFFFFFRSCFCKAFLILPPCTPPQNESKNDFHARPCYWLHEGVSSQTQSSSLPWSHTKPPTVCPVCQCSGSRPLVLVNKRDLGVTEIFRAIESGRQESLQNSTQLWLSICLLWAWPSAFTHVSS